MDDDDGLGLYAFINRIEQVSEQESADVCLRSLGSCTPCSTIIGLPPIIGTTCPPVPKHVPLLHSRGSISGPPRPRASGTSRLTDGMLHGLLHSRDFIGPVVHLNTEDHMLLLTRKANESLQIGTDIVLKVSQISPGRVKLCIEAPRSMRIMRREIDGDWPGRSSPEGQRETLVR